MSTRSVIARRAGDGFRGVYHHYDGYPSGLGKTLWKRAQEVSVKELLKTLIDDHPAGWSTINGVDWSLRPGYSNSVPDDDGMPRRPQCYCHGDRNEGPMPVTETDDLGMEWAYVFEEDMDIMYVLERVVGGHHMTGMFGSGDPDNQTWAYRATVDLTGPEPDWAVFENVEDY